MPLSNQVFTPGNTPDHSNALTQIALNRPNVFKAFNEGYDQAQKRQLALQQYREAKVKADLAQAMYPHILQEQQRALQARMDYYDNPNQYSVQPSTIAATPKPISVTPTAKTYAPNDSDQFIGDGPGVVPLYPYKSTGGMSLQDGSVQQFPGIPPISGFTTSDAEPVSFNPFGDYPV